MEPVLFYGVPQGCSFGSIVALEWLNQPYRLCRINMPADMQTDLYARINPVRETPALLLENGTVLTESAAILQNLAARGVAQGLGFTQGTVEFDRLNQRLAFLNTTFFSAFAPLWHAYEMEENPPVQTMLRDLGRNRARRERRTGGSCGRPRRAGPPRPAGNSGGWGGSRGWRRR